MATLFYLLFICIIHTAFPSVFTASNADIPLMQSTATYNQTVLAYQDFGYVIVVCHKNLPSRTSHYSNISQMNFDVYNFLNEYNTFSPPRGLQNNLIYDILPANTPRNIEYVMVNTTSFSVLCTYLSGVTFQALGSIEQAPENVHVSLPITLQDQEGFKKLINISYTSDLDMNTSSNVTLLPMCRFCLLIT